MVNFRKAFSHGHQGFLLPRIFASCESMQTDLKTRLLRFFAHKCVFLMTLIGHLLVVKLHVSNEWRSVRFRRDFYCSSSYHWRTNNELIMQIHSLRKISVVKFIQTPLYNIYCRGNLRINKVAWSYCEGECFWPQSQSCGERNTKI
jgi:hypothetical protein